MGDVQSIAERVRYAYSQDWLAMDAEELESRLREVFDPRVVFVPEAGGGVAASGLDEVHRLLTDARGEWTSCRYLLDEVRRVGPAEAVVRGWVVATSQSSESRVSFPFLHVWHARGTRIDRIEATRDRDEAAKPLELVS